MAKNNSEEINFQQYVDGVKQKKISWKFFTAFIQDLSYSDINRLRKLNAMLLTELTMNYSDMDKFKYLNKILLIQFKNHIEREYADCETSEDDCLEECQESNVDQILNEETTEEIPMDENIQMQIIVNEIKDDLMSPCKEEIIEFNTSKTNQKIFLCYICNKEYNLYFHLKQHLKNIRGKKKVLAFSLIQSIMIKNLMKLLPNL